MSATDTLLWGVKHVDIAKLAKQKAKAETDRLYGLYQSQCAVHGERPDVLIARYGAWLVTGYGVECATQHYPIQASALHGPHWIRHMSQKHWCNLADFALALEHAREHFATHRGTDGN